MLAALARLYFTWASLQPGQSVSFLLSGTVRAGACSPIVNHASVTSATPELNPMDNEAQTCTQIQRPSCCSSADLPRPQASPLLKKDAFRADRQFSRPLRMQRASEGWKDSHAKRPPSPRRAFCKRCCPPDQSQTKTGRIGQQDACVLYADTANMTQGEFLSIEPINFVQCHEKD